ncbi:(2Fe-2S)-binding protein [bacterium]|nr:(2Fe-2S)-binding protein [bacterium]
MKVNRCVCENLTFEEMKKVVDRFHCKTVGELQTRIKFGVNCRLCLPYVEKMIATGETHFDIIEM